MLLTAWRSKDALRSRSVRCSVSILVINRPSRVGWAATVLIVHSDYANSDNSMSSARVTMRQHDRIPCVAKRKNPAAVALGRLGGRAAAGRGAKARLAAMTAEERRELARRAARARWGKRPER